jgi:hypothetical protein
MMASESNKASDIRLWDCIGACYYNYHYRAGREAGADAQPKVMQKTQMCPIGIAAKKRLRKESV